jgi:hypothetical protein
LGLGLQQILDLQQQQILDLQPERKNASRYYDFKGGGGEDKMDKHDGQLAAQPSPTWMQCEQGTCLP